MNVIRHAAMVLIFASASAHAAYTNPLIGNWVETFPNGHQMVTRLTTGSIEKMNRDTSGTLSKPIASGHVAYRDLGTSSLGQGYAIDFLGQDGKPSGGIMAFVKGADEMTLDFPGMGAHHTKRLSQ